MFLRAAEIGGDVAQDGIRRSPFDLDHPRAQQFLEPGPDGDDVETIGEAPQFNGQSQGLKLLDQRFGMGIVRRGHGPLHTHDEGLGRQACGLRPKLRNPALEAGAGGIGQAVLMLWKSRLKGREVLEIRLLAQIGLLDRRRASGQEQSESQTGPGGEATSRPERVDP